jgi:hypothetical protein
MAKRRGDWLVVAMVVGMPMLGSAAALSVTRANNDQPAAQMPCTATDTKADLVDTAASAQASPAAPSAQASPAAHMSGSGGGGQDGFHHEIPPLDLAPDAPPLIEAVDPLPDDMGGVDIGMTDEGLAAKAQAERGQPPPTSKSPACRLGS